LEKELKDVEKEMQKVEAKLGNEKFLQRAPAEIVQKEKAKKEEYDLRRSKLGFRLGELKSL
jgi:valyl-tRNA synthetase